MSVPFVLTRFLYIKEEVLMSLLISVFEKDWNINKMEFKTTTTTAPVVLAVLRAAQSLSHALQVRFVYCSGSGSGSVVIWYNDVI